MSWLQIRLFGSYFSSFSTNSYGYYSQMSQNLISNDQIFASAQIVRQAARVICQFSFYFVQTANRSHTFVIYGQLSAGSY